MCIAISYHNKDHYFGRNLDLDVSYGEQVVVTPRNRNFPLRNGREYRNPYALIGMAAVVEDYPLYYEAVNEKGIFMAGLNFPESTVYRAPEEGRDNIAPFELLPWILGQSATLEEAEVLLRRLNLVKWDFRENMPAAPLHYMVSDGERSLVLEATARGMELHENPYHVLSNEPPFQYHSWNMRQYRHLGPDNGAKRFGGDYPLNGYCVGMGAKGLPGDVSSPSRFVRAAFHLANSRCEAHEEACVTQVFHVLESVAMVRGAAITASGSEDLTQTSCCVNGDRGIYYYRTYENSQITAVDLHRCNLDGGELTCFPLRREQQIRYETGI